MELEKAKNSDIKFHVFSSEMYDSLKTLLELYDKDPRKANIYYKMNKSNSFVSYKTVIFEYPNKDFRFCVIQKKYGISKTNRIYSREKTCTAISYKHKNKTMYLIHGNSVRPATYENISTILTKNDFEDFLKIANDKFGWLRNIAESKVIHSFPFNNVMRYKLYNKKDILKHIYKIPYPVIEKFTTDGDGYKVFEHYYLKPLIKKIKEHAINIENLTPQFVLNEYFSDTLNMADILQYKINCNWSVKRLKEMHDKWAKELLAFQLEFEPLIQLNIHNVYLMFAEFTNYELLKTNHDLIAEGKLMNHCVGTYTNSVNSGRCAIFRVAGHTLEVSYHNTDYFSSNDKSNKLHMSQLRGFSNASAPKELKEAVSKAIDDFNDKFKYELISSKTVDDFIDLETLF